jgi:opacity protein-like surface antigen
MKKWNLADPGVKIPTLLILAFILALTLCSAAFAGSAGNPDPSQWYLGAKGGVSFQNAQDANASQAAGAFGGYAGYNFMGAYGVPVRAGLDFTYRAPVNSAMGGSLSMPTLTGNLYYDIRNSSQLTPFVTAGAGLAFLNGNGPSLLGGTNGYSSTAFAVNAGAGVSWALSPLVALDLEYLFTICPSSQVAYTNPYSNDVMAGIRLNF